MSMKRLLLTLAAVILTVVSQAQGIIRGVGHPEVIGLRTNLVYDALLLPNLGIEYGFGDRWSVLGSLTADWIEHDRSHYYWRMLCGEVEGRMWLDGDYRAYRMQGQHVGAYAALYRYDIEFGHKGNQSDLSYGLGLSYGYSLCLWRSLSLDFTAAVGYIGGKYREYEPQDGEYHWLADKWRHYVGPTRVEAALVWHIDLPKKGGWKW